MSIKTRLDKIESSLVMEEPTVYEFIATRPDESKSKALRRLKLPKQPKEGVVRWFFLIVSKAKKKKVSKHSKSINTYRTLISETTDKKKIADYELKIKQLQELMVNES